MASSSCFWLRGRTVEAFQHEVHQGFPTVKAQVAGQGLDVVEQPLARGQFLAQKLELVVRPVQSPMIRAKRPKGALIVCIITVWSIRLLYRTIAKMRIAAMPVCD